MLFPSQRRNEIAETHNHTHTAQPPQQSHIAHTQRTVLKRLVVNLLMRLQVQMVQQRRGPCLPLALRFGGQAHNQRREITPTLGHAWLRGLRHCSCSRPCYLNCASFSRYCCFLLLLQIDAAWMLASPPTLKLAAATRARPRALACPWETPMYQ